MSGDAALQDMIDRVRKLGEGPEAIAREAAPRVEAAVKATAAAGTTPDGAKWAPKKNGQPALVNAAAAVEARPIGASVQLRLNGTVTGSQTAQAIQNHTRNIIPAKGGSIPKTIVDGLKAAADAVFAKVVAR